MIIYSKYNSSRKEQFQLITAIEKEGGALFSLKIADGKNAEIFLASFFEKYDYLKNNNFSFNPIEPKKVNGKKVNFEYKQGKTLDNLLFEFAQKSDRDGFIGLLNKYAARIKENKIKKGNLSVEFREIFGGESKMKFDLVQIGCLDLNFDNLILDNETNEFWVIDYEWTFNFSVPYKYIIFRALTAFYNNYFFYNLNKNFIKLAELYDFFEIAPAEKNAFIGFEYNFQQYVQNSLKISLEECRKSYANLEADYVGFDYVRNVRQKDREIANLNQAIQENREIRNLNLAVRQKDREIANLNQVVQQKIQQIAFMESSKFWKLRHYYLQAKSAVFSFWKFIKKN